MVTIESIISFIIVGLLWGASDAFMEVGSQKKNEQTQQQSNHEDDLEKGNKAGTGPNDKKKEIKKKEKKRKEKKVQRKKINKLKRFWKKKGRNSLTGKKNNKDSLEETNIMSE